MIASDFLDDAALAALGLGRYGVRVRISAHALLLRPEDIRLGDDVRIDAFCLLSPGDGGLSIGSFVHVSAYTCIVGRGPAVIEDFATVSARCSIFTSNDDYSGATLTNPTVPDDLRGASHGAVRIRRHAIVGAGSVVLPGVTVGASAAVGALTLVNGDVADFAIVAGTPMREIGRRRDEHLALGDQLLDGP